MLGQRRICREVGLNLAEVTIGVPTVVPAKHGEPRAAFDPWLADEMWDGVHRLSIDPQFEVKVRAVRSPRGADEAYPLAAPYAPAGLHRDAVLVTVERDPTVRMND